MALEIFEFFFLSLKTYPYVPEPRILFINKILFVSEIINIFNVLARLFYEPLLFYKHIRVIRLNHMYLSLYFK